MPPSVPDRRPPFGPGREKGKKRKSLAVFLSFAPPSSIASASVAAFCSQARALFFLLSFPAHLMTNNRANKAFLLTCAPSRSQMYSAPRPTHTPTEGRQQMRLEPWALAWPHAQLPCSDFGFRGGFWPATSRLALQGGNRNRVSRPGSVFAVHIPLHVSRVQHAT